MLEESLFERKRRADVDCDDLSEAKCFEKLFLRFVERGFTKLLNK